MSGGALKEVLASFDVDVANADKKLDAVDKKITNVTNTLGALAEAFVGSAIVHGLAEFIQSQIEAGSRVNDLSEKLGVGTDELQAFQFAAGLAGVSSESAAKGLQFLNKNVGEAIDGNKGAAETFAKLGIALKDGSGKVRETTDLLPELADKFAGMGSDAERTAFAMKVFGKAGADLLPLLKGGSEGAAKMFEEFQRLGGGMSKDFIKAADEAGDEIDKVKFAFNGWKSQIVFAILPAVTKVAKGLQVAVGMLRRVTKETNLAKGMWVLFGAGAAAATAKAAVGFGKLLGVIPKDASFWKAALGLGEIFLVIAAIALLYLAFDDFYTFLTGGQSVIGDVIESLFGVGASEEVIKEVNAALAQMGEAFKSLEPLIALVGKMLGDIFVAAAPFLKAYFKLLLSSFAFSVKTVAKLIQTVTNLFGQQLQGLGKFAAVAGDFLGNDKLKEIGVAVATTGVNLQAATRAPEAGRENMAYLPQRRAPEGGANVNMTNNVTNNITGVKDAAGAGEAAGKGTREALEGELSDAMAGGG